MVDNNSGTQGGSLIFWPLVGREGLDIRGIGSIEIRRAVFIGWNQNNVANTISVIAEAIANSEYQSFAAIRGRCFTRAECGP